MGHPAIIISYSELDAARQCFLKHQLAYRERWTRDTRSESALSRGILWHNVMENHYASLRRTRRAGEIPHIDAEADEIINRLCGRDTGDPTPDQDLISWMYEGYVEMWGNDKPWTVLAVEHAAQIRLPTPTGGRSRFILKLKIDLVVKQDGKIWVVDHKSGRNLPTDKELAVNDQFGLYTWAMRQLGYEVFGSKHNAARTQRNKDDSRTGQPLDTRFSRTPMYRTDKELDCIAHDAYEWAKLAWQRREEGVDAPRSPNEDTCKWRCDFLEPCLAGRKGIDTMPALMVDFGFHQDFERH